MPPTGVLVSALHCYPIKSCGGIPLDVAAVDDRGIRNDREFMVVGETGRFLSQRELPRMALIRPELRDGRLTLQAPGVPPVSLLCAEDGPRAEVTVHDVACTGIDQGDVAARWLGEFIGTPCRLMRMPRDFVRPVDPHYATRRDDQVGFADLAPFLLLSEASLADLNARLPTPLGMHRFRPNIVVSGCEPYAEDSWKRIRIGDVVFTAMTRCRRCVITTIDPATAERGLEPLRTLATYRRDGTKVAFGQYLAHDGTGTLELGDRVEVLA